MSTDSNADSGLLQNGFGFRLSSLQEVVAGRMTPLERRIRIAQRRPNLFLGRLDSSPGHSATPEVEQDGGNDEEPEQESDSVKPVEKVEVDVSSPTEDELRAANTLAEKHADAEAVRLLPDGKVQLREATGGTFTREVSDVLERELGEKRSPGTTASVSSMSVAAAERYS